MSMDTARSLAVARIRDCAAVIQHCSILRNT